MNNKVTHSFSQCKRSDVVAILNNADPFNNQKSAENYAKVLLQNLKPFGIRSKDIDVYSLGRLHSQYRSQVYLVGIVTITKHLLHICLQGVGVALKNTVAKAKSVCGKAETYSKISTVSQGVKTLPFHGRGMSSSLIRCMT